MHHRARLLRRVLLGRGRSLQFLQAWIPASQRGPLVSQVVPHRQLAEAFAEAKVLRDTGLEVDDYRSLALMALRILMPCSIHQCRNCKGKGELGRPPLELQICGRCDGSGIEVRKYEMSSPEGKVM